MTELSEIAANVFEDWRKQWSTPSAAPAQDSVTALQDWIQRWNTLPLSPGPEPLTVLGDYLRAGDIKEAAGIAFGRGAQAKAEGVPLQPDRTMVEGLAALTRQIFELSQNVAALTKQCSTLNKHLAAREAQASERGEGGSGE